MAWPEQVKISFYQALSYTEQSVLTDFRGELGEKKLLKEHFEHNKHSEHIDIVVDLSQEFSRRRE